MTDIVERLQHDADSFNDCCLLCSEAADEIERNRAAIAELVAALRNLSGSTDLTTYGAALHNASAIIAKHETPTTTKEQA